MYSFLLALHSLVRWLILVGLLMTIFRGYRGWLLQKKFSTFDNTIRITTTTVAHIQLVLGICLYVISPMVRYFLQYFKEAVHQREIRFFGMEHITMMLIAIVLITIGSVKTKRQPTDKQRFKTMAIWYTIALIIILASIPWQFSPLISRPYFRAF